MNTKCKLIIFGFLMNACLRCFGQDHMYSQFFNSPLYLNPALTGQMDDGDDLRITMIYRNQFTSVPGSFNYLSASVDYTLPKYGGGIGLLVTRSSEGTAFLNTNNISGTYAYSVGSDNLIVTFGLQAGISNTTIDWSNLVFGDQISPQYGYIPGSTSAAQPPVYNNRFYFDSGAGINVRTGTFDAGFAAQHLNMPNTSFSGTPIQLPIRFTAHADYWIDLYPDDNNDKDDKTFVVPSVVVYQQGGSGVYNVGVDYKRANITAGLCYRSGGTGGGPTAVVLTLVFDLFVSHPGAEKFRFGVSHDVPVSSLNYSNTSGTTEGSIGYETSVPYRDQSEHRFQGASVCPNLW